MTSPDSHDDEVSSNQYNIQIDSAHGPVIGDFARVQQSFYFYSASPNGELDAEQRRNRERMLERVRSIWVTNFLNESLRGIPVIIVRLCKQPDAVSSPWERIVQPPRLPEQALPVEKNITQDYEAFKEWGEELLILGEAGAGKTILLLELTHMLLNHAARDERYPIPVVFNLSSWGIKHQPLRDWLIEELHSRYEVPLSLSRTWVDGHQIAPLLDGLDEVAISHRAACVEAINTYKQEQGFLPIVVCSRQTDYLALSKRLFLRTAVVVQPLTSEQIESYLTRGGERLIALRQMLREDTDLQELACTPLMLTVLSVAYEGSSQEQVIAADSPQTKQNQIFATYVRRMLTRRGVVTRYTLEQTTSWLGSLAHQMKRQSQTIFYLEQMQANWLSDNWRRWAYRWLAVRLPGVLIGILVSLSISTFISSGPIILEIGLGGLIGGFLSDMSIPQQSAEKHERPGSNLAVLFFQWVVIGALVGLGGDLLIGPLGGLILGLSSTVLQFLFWGDNEVEARLQAQPPPKDKIWQRLLQRRAVRIGLLVGLVYGLIYGLLTGLFAGLGPNPLNGLGVGLSNGLLAGETAGLSSGLLCILLSGLSSAIQPTDRLVWSLESLAKSLFLESHVRMTLRVIALLGLTFGTAEGLAFGVTAALQVGPGNGLTLGLISVLAFWLTVAPIYGVIYWSLLGLFQGVSSTTIEDKHRVRPNQGMRHSALNGLVLGFISAVIVGLLNWLSNGFNYGLGYGLISTVVSVQRYGLFPALVYGLNYGLGAGVSRGLALMLPEAFLAGLSAGILTGLLKGGLSYLRHYVLRFLLWRRRSVPWHYIPFLEYATGRILLRKVGGGYVFLHRLLLDYFAAQESALSPNESLDDSADILAADPSPSVISKPTTPAVLSDPSPRGIDQFPTAPLGIAHSLPCGHALRTPTARFCSVCGTPIAMPALTHESLSPGVSRQRVSELPNLSTLPQQQSSPRPSRRRASYCMLISTLLLVLIVVGGGGATALLYQKSQADISALIPNPYPPHTGKQVLSDPLYDNSRGYGWSMFANKYTACRFTVGAYEIDTSTHIFQACYATRSPQFSNFAVEVQMDIFQGDCGAILFRVDSVVNRFYDFEICQNGRYSVSAYNGSSWSSLIDFRLTSAIHRGLNHMNLVAVVATGSHLDFYVNHQRINSASNRTYSQGQIGILASGYYGNPTIVLFNSVRVWALG